MIVEKIHGNNTMISTDPLENLLPSLVQCFSIIFLGYLAVRWSLITSQAQALGTYVTKFALPALFFRSMATINFSDVNWYFILAVSLGKLLLFVITILLVVLITRPINLGMAGILSMFITQSNDVALGYPILLSLYPDLAKYIYLFGPTQLVFINPLCFMLLEWHEYRTASVTENNLHIPVNRRILLVLKNVLLNPLVYMTVVGVIFNFILSHHLPLIIDKTLQILADSFSGVALFYLGMNMVNKLGSITKKGIYILVFILLGKLLFLPFMTRELVVHLVGLQLSANETLNYSLMGFLYGGLPTAPPVFLIASDFQILPDVIATGLVVGTFLSGPLMFITGRVITMVIASRYQYDNILQSTAISMSILSILGCIWVLVVFVLSRRFRSPVHKVTICYTISVLLLCLGLVIGRIFLPNTISQPNSIPSWGHYIQFSIFFIGCTGARIWTCLIALSLAIVKRKNICVLMNNLKYFYLFGFCFPVLITSAIVIFASKQKTADMDPSFQYGKTQMICSSVVLAFSIVTTAVSLVFQARRGFLDHIGLAKKLNESNQESANNNAEYMRIFDEDNNASTLNGLESETCSQIDCHRINLQRYRDNLSSDEIVMFDSVNDEEFQMYRHMTLSILLVVTMGFGFFLCLWRLVNEVISGIYVELEFLDCVFNFGQGFLLWAIFGLDTKLIVIPFKKKIMKLCHNISVLYIPKETHLSLEVRRIKNDFVTNHLDNCHKEISKNMRHNFKLYRNVFTGKQLINWILKAGLEDDRLKAHAYGQALLISRVIEHVLRRNNLKDDNECLYQFVESHSDSSLESDSSQVTDIADLE